MESSDGLPVTSGVPQGYVLGPLPLIIIVKVMDVDMVMNFSKHALIPNLV